MAYTDQKQNRTVAVGAVALVHAAIGAALLSGLAVTFTRKPPTIIEGYAVPVDPPPPPKPLPPEPKLERSTPTRPSERVVAPIPRVPTEATLDVPIVTEIIPPAPFDFAPGPAVEPAPPPSPPPANLSRGLQPKGDQGGWFPRDSYPAAARRAGAEGRVGVSVDVGTDGRVAACRVVSSSGNDDLDAATCRLATRNGRFEPARDAAGNKLASSVALRPVRWTLEQ